MAGQQGELPPRHPATVLAQGWLGVLFGLMPQPKPNSFMHG